MENNMRRFHLLWSCVFVSLLSSLAYSQATPPSADAMTLSTLPNKNYGSYTALFVQTGPATSNSYIQFDLATLPSPVVVQKATLRLYVDQFTTAGSFDVYQLNTSWTESTLTYDNAPALGSSATGGNPTPFTTTSLNQFILIDITPLVQRWVNGSLTNNGLALAMTTSAGAIAFDSKEATLTSHQPELEIVLASTGGGGGVTSWNSRTGAVVPQSGDYSFSLLSGILEDPQLGGTYMSNVLNFANSGNSFTGTSFIGGAFTGNGSGLTNVPVSAGSPFYIQNGSSQQTGASFNIDGNGTLGGTLTASTGVNTDRAYKISGNLVLDISLSEENTFVGNYAGNGGGYPGIDNTFVGDTSGFSNTSGNENSALGTEAGISNNTGSYNSYIGAFSGHSNVSGTDNTLVGSGAGQDLLGSSNTFVGSSAGSNLVNGDNNTFLGGGAGGTATAAASDIYIANTGVASENNTIRIGTQGTGAGQQNIVYLAGITSQTITGGSPVYINSNGMLGIGSSSGGVTSWNGRTGAVVPQSGDYDFSLISGTVGTSQLSGTYSSALTLSNPSNVIDGTFSGNGAGLTNVPVSTGSPFYIQNGTSQQASANFNISGNGTVGGTLVGTTAVNTNGTYQIGGSTVVSTAGTENLFLGASTGTNASYSTFIGPFAGQANTTGSYNVFIGDTAGNANTSGMENVFIGDNTGDYNTTGNQNTYVGIFSGDTNTTGNQNTFLGYDAGRTTTTGSYDIMIGVEAGTNVYTGKSDILIGSTGASASESNTIRIGTQGTASGQQNTVYIAGITSQTIASGSPVYVNSNGMLGVGSGGGSGVTSWNGRTGAVVPQSGDYSFSLLSGTLGSSQLSGTYSNPITLSNSGNSFVGNGSGLTNVPISSGSTYYIQNGTSQQTSASFNIDGNGTAAGTLAGTTGVNTSGSYQIAGNAVLAVSSDGVSTSLGRASATPAASTYNTFLGYDTGVSGATATENTCVGPQACSLLTIGTQNDVVGTFAGDRLTTGSDNTFLGYTAGSQTTTGSYNIFLGQSAGLHVSTGSSDIYLGYTAGGTENNTIRIGTPGTGNGQQNTTYIAGINGTTVSGGSPVFVDSNGMLGLGASGNSGVTSWDGRTGAVAPQSGDYSFSLISGTASIAQIPSLASLYIQNTTTQQATSNFNISGNGTAAGTLAGTTAVNTNGTYEIGGVTVVNIPNNSSLNTFIGASAGNSGSSNTFVGAFAGVGDTTGTNNLFLGETAGEIITTGSSDIYVGTSSTSASESNTIRIGTQGTGSGQQNATYIAGIRGETASGGINVLIASNGKLGTTTSSRRFKDNILDMGDASSKLFQLRPVTFFYKPEYDDGSHILQYGLIAEEVAKIYPDLVAYGKDGQPETVRYHLLAPMLLNEVQKQQKVMSAQQDVIATQQQQIESLQQRVQRLEALVGNLAKASSSGQTVAAHQQ
jgi:hypothetical protein